MALRSAAPVAHVAGGAPRRCGGERLRNRCPSRCLPPTELLLQPSRPAAEADAAPASHAQSPPGAARRGGRDTPTDATPSAADVLWETALAAAKQSPPPRSSRGVESPVVAPAPQPPARGGARAPDHLSFSSLARFVAPSIAIWVAGPILSLVDVSVVGLSSTIDLAALGPATSLADSTSYVFSFLAVATTSMVARSLAGGERHAASEAIAGALSSAALCGLLLAAFLLVACPTCLAAYAGAASAAVVPPAAAYVRIRAIGMPFALALAVSQAGFLAAKQPGVPLQAVCLAAGANLVGDLVLCCGFGCGIVGAAVATTAAQVLACAYMLAKLLAARPEGGAPLLRALPHTLLAPPDQLAAQWRIGGPVAALIAVKVALMGFAVGGAASALSPDDSAAHVVLYSIYIFAAVIGDAVSQAAQTFLPETLGRPSAAKSLARSLLATGFALGAANCVWAGAVAATSPGAFTTSPSVAALIVSVAPVMALSLVIHTASMATEGMLLASTDLSFLLASYARNAALCFVTLCVATNAGWGLHGVWLVLVQFHTTRLTQNMHRLYLSPQSPLKRGAQVAPVGDGVAPVAA